MKEDFYQKLIAVTDTGRIKRNEPLKNYTTLHIGGDTDYFITPEKENEICNIISVCKENKIPFFVLGNGSNLLVSDKGYRGVIIHLNESFSTYRIDEEGMAIAQSGILLSKLSKKVAEKELTGFEFAEGIPGTLGGAVTMNAGAYGGEIKDRIVYAKVLDMDGNIFVLNKEQLQLGYRRSILQEKKYILLEAGFKFEKGNPNEIKEKMLGFRNARREKQPLEKFSAGSTFKRPEGYFAGKLISDSGLRGYTIGDISVSEKHCGFVINNGNGTAADFLLLVKHIIQEVEKNYGVTLEPEIKLLGDF